LHIKVEKVAVYRLTRNGSTIPPGVAVLDARRNGIAGVTVSGDPALL
jgi:hypothetical protein